MNYNVPRRYIKQAGHFTNYRHQLQYLEMRSQGWLSVAASPMRYAPFLVAETAASTSLDAPPPCVPSLFALLTCPRRVPPALVHGDESNNGTSPLPANNVPS
ncbi:MAG: hypothetical protein ABSB61_07635 [Anaerolineales bacterium]|jgi:hypothetical protein